jgi:beta-N-acetylhexosaminidase
VLELKVRVGLIDKMDIPDLSEAEKESYELCAEQVAEKSVTLIRNEGNLIPLSLKAGAKILTVTCQFNEKLRGLIQELEIVDEELRSRGFEVDHLKNPVGHDIWNVMNDYDAIFMNVHVLCRYGSIFMTDDLARIFWESFWPEHPCVVFTSFGDPYKLYEMPSVPNMINVYGSSPCSQRAAVKVWLGEIPPQGKSPVELKGFFTVEV